MAGRELLQSVARDIYVFMTSSTDHVSGVAGLAAGLTITYGKAGAALATGTTPAITDRGNGWYKFALLAGHVDTIGDLAWHVTGAGCDPTDFKDEVIVDPASASALASAQSNLTTLISLLTPTRAGYLDNLSGGAVALNATVALASALATAQTSLTTLEGRITSGRAGYLDNLNVGGAVASSAEVVSIQNNTRVVRVVPNVIERPDSGTSTYVVELLLYDSVGNMEAPDGAPTIALVNQALADKSARLSATTMVLVSTGRYRVTYTADVGDALEQLIWTFSVLEGGLTRVYGNSSLIVDTTAVDFTAADRTKLETLATDYSTARAAQLDNLDATVSSRATQSSLDALATVVDGVATQSSLDTLATVVDGISSSMSTLVADVVTGLFDHTIEAAPAGATTFVQRLRVQWSLLMGIARGLANTEAASEAFRDAADTKDRATFELGADGTRTPGTFDGT